jgi:ABC-type Fe3+ transport system permease subunit
VGDGIAAAKIAGIFLVAWVTWYLASLHVPVWSQTGILIALISLAVLSFITVWKQRSEFGKWLRQYWKRLVVIELITLTFFLVMIGVVEGVSPSMEEAAQTLRANRWQTLRYLRHIAIALAKEKISAYSKRY